MKLTHLFLCAIIFLTIQFAFTVTTFACCGCPPCGCGPRPSGGTCNDNDPCNTPPKEPPNPCSQRCAGTSGSATSCPIDEKLTIPDCKCVKDCHPPNISCQGMCFPPCSNPDMDRNLEHCNCECLMGMVSCGGKCRNPCPAGKAFTEACKCGDCNPDGTCEDDGKYCTDDICENGLCTHPEKKDIVLTPSIYYTADWNNSVAKAIAKFLEKLDIVEEVKMKVVVAGINRETCCEKKQEQTITSEVRVGGRLEVRLPPKRFWVPSLPGLFLELEIKCMGGVNLAVKFNRCTDKMPEIPSSYIFATVRFEGRAGFAIPNIIEVVPASIGTGISCDDKLEDRKLCIDCDFMGVWIKTSVKFLDRTITFIDSYLVQPAPITSQCDDVSPDSLVGIGD